MNKLISKLYVLPGGPVTTTDDTGTKLTGVVEQANPDGAMFVRFPGIEHLHIVMGPAPKPAVLPVVAPEAAKKLGAAETEVRRLQALVADQDAQLAEQATRIAKLEAAAKVVPEAGAQGMTAAAAKPALAAGEEDDGGDKHFT
jgi:hypothetical protein